MTRARNLTTRLIVAIALAASVSILTAEEKSIAGSWTLHAEGYTMSMALTQKGTAIEGTLDSPHGPMPLKGEFVDGRLKLSGAGENVHHLEVTLTGTMKSDGTLAGDLTSNVGDMSWTAVRESKK
jgi:hypothetical protein